MQLDKKTRAVLAEFVAMTLFVFVGCGTAVSSQSILGFNGASQQDNSFLTAVATAFGFGITVLAYSIAPISGGHINPAVTLSFVVLKKMSVIDGLKYFGAQFLGATLGAAIVWGCSTSSVLEVGGAPPFLLGSNGLSPGLGAGSAFLIEAMGTFLLVWTVMMTAVHKKSIAGNIAPIAIGWSVLLAHLVLIPFTGCGINPARSFGPHVVVAMAGHGSSLESRGIWVYYIAPFVGAVVAAFMTSLIFGLDEDEDDDSDDEDANTEEPKPEQVLETKADEEN